LGEAPKKKMLDVGELCIPELLDEMTDIFIIVKNFLPIFQTK